MEAVLQILVWLVFGGICASIAHSRGRTPIGWFFVGLVAPCLGLILVLVLPDMKKQAQREARMRDENRRLRERVRKDRMVADRRQAEVEARLTTHDRALGVDTSNKSVAIEAGDAYDDAGRDTAPDAGPEPPPMPPRSQPPAPEPEASPEEPVGTRWFFAEGDARRGPVALDRMRELWSAGKLDADTLVWNSEMTDWRAIGEIEGLAGELGTPA